MGMRTVHENKLGNVLYAFAAYEKVKRVTIPIRRKTDNERMHILMISFDIDTDHAPIITDKVLPLLKELVLL